jgi:hypothetical protein
VEYFGVPQEAAAIIENSRPPAYWPSSNGELVVDDLVVRYAPDLPAVLRNLTFTIKPSEKIGVVSIPFSRHIFGLTVYRAGREDRIWEIDSSIVVIEDD